MPFVFASGAEFTDSEKSGAARVNEIFSIARRNVSHLILLSNIVLITSLVIIKWLTFLLILPFEIDSQLLFLSSSHQCVKKI